MCVCVCVCARVHVRTCGHASVYVCHLCVSNKAEVCDKTPVPNVTFLTDARFKVQDHFIISSKKLHWHFDIHHNKQNSAA